MGREASGSFWFLSKAHNPDHTGELSKHDAKGYSHKLCTYHLQCFTTLLKHMLQRLVLTLVYVAGLGITSTIVEIYICVYYNVILAWCLYYIWASFTSVLPWATCGNEWNTEHCADFTSSTTLSNSNIFNHILNHLVLFSEIYLHQSWYWKEHKMIY